MHRRTRLSVAIAAALVVSASATPAATIIKLNLGGVGPDVGMAQGGVFSTIDQTGGPPPTGDQFTDIEYTGFLNFIPDLNTNTSTFSLSGFQATGAATVVGPLVIQNFTGGSFRLYDPADNLLLQATVPNSVLTGNVGVPGTGSLFSSTLGVVTGGSLAPQLAPGSISLSLQMTTVNGGAGFSIGGATAPILNPFVADATLSIAADPIPEPTSLMLLGVGATVTMLGRRRNR